MIHFTQDILSSPEGAGGPPSAASVDDTEATPFRLYATKIGPSSSRNRELFKHKLLIKVLEAGDTIIEPFDS
jgi:hypothetical protein